MRLLLLIIFSFIYLVAARRDQNQEYTGASYRTINRCSFPIWVGTESSQFQSSIQLKSYDGWMLQPGNSYTYNTQKLVRTTKFWGRTKCSGEDGSFLCETGQCGPSIQCDSYGSYPITVAQFTNININPNQVIQPIFSQNPTITPLFNYGISLINGFNLNLTIVPRKNGCNTTSCNFNLQNCSDDSVSQNKNNEITGCNTLCDKTKFENDCCLGNIPCNQNNLPNSEAKFRAACPFSIGVSNRKGYLNLCENHQFDVLYC